MISALVLPFRLLAHFDAIPRDHLGVHDFSNEEDTHVWQMPDGTHQHILVVRSPNVFLALVLNPRTASVTGHHLLDLNQLYGLNQPPTPPLDNN